MRLGMLLLAGILFALPLVNAEEIRLSGLHIPDTVYAGEAFDLQVILSTETRDWSTIVSIPELGIVEYGGRQSLSQNSHTFVDLPTHVVWGEYLVRVQVRQSDDDEAGTSRFKHRWISIVG
ncbi:MAG: hypothetical protein Q7K43_04280 [Candidatus Woesearchaeota archaeon]|nr:hypothetical protein [Candidatus Woesearchaeota archaeon]